MAAALGSLVVKLGLDAAEFITGMERSDREAKKFAKQMEANGKVIGQALGLGVAAASSALFLMTKNAIDAADKLNDLSKATGISVETLGGLGFAAQQSGTDLDGVAAAAGKLNIQIAKAAAGSEESGAAFKAMGISVKDVSGNIKSADAVLIELADKFASYEDGANKAALGNAAFGKSYQSMIPLLNEGGEKLKQNIAYYEKYGGITTKTAQQSDEFNDTLAKLGLLSGQFGRQLAVELLPALNSLAEAFVKGTEKGGAFKDSASDIADVIKGIAVAAIGGSAAVASLGNVIGARAAQAAALARFDFAAIKAINADLAKDEADRAERANRLINAIRNPTAGLAGAGTPPRPLGKAPGLPDKGAQSDADAVRKALLEANLKAIDRAIKEEEDLLKDREHFLTQYYQDDVIGIRQYFAQLQAGRDQYIAKERAAFAEQEALLRSYKPKNEQERIANEEKLADLIGKKTKAEREYSKAYVDARLAEERAAKQFQQTVDQLAISLRAARGDVVGAAGAGFDAQNAQFRAQLIANGRSTADLDEDRRRTVDRAALTKATEDYSIVLDRLGIAQERINLQAETGSISELTAMRRKDELAKQYVVTLTAQADAYEKIALAMDMGPARERALLDVEKMRLGIDQLAASGDSLARKFNDQIGTAFADNLTAVLDRTKTLKQGFEDLGKSITHMLNQVIADELKTYLFGGKGANGSGGILSSLINAGVSYFTGSPSSSGLGYGTAGSAIPSGPYPYANGTNFHPGGWAMVGEFGKELINLPRGAQVIPNSELMRRRGERDAGNTYITVNPPVGVTRASANQSASVMVRRMQQAGRNL